MFIAPRAVSPDLPVCGDLNGVLPLRASAGVAVLSPLLGLLAGAQGRGEEVLGGLQQLEAGRALPVGDGAGHGGVDAPPDQDGEAEAVALVS